ncbi:MAG: carboxylating nicotinate-nucleotide diphosphorylase [Betaproteobacteria bacterium]|nr:carboxylating nicotinate-nucleotide diphosphorylase [Betaproteobacteria bacterium]
MAKNDIAADAAADAAAALAEDIGGGDLSAGLVDNSAPRTGILRVRENTVLCGRLWFESCFLQLDSAAAFNWRAAEGGEIAAGQTVCEVRALPRALLGGERAALNFLQTLSATAFAARRMQKLAGKTAVTDTRKTLPKLRAAQKYAVRIGGAQNHRLGLFDEILIKENHIAAAGGIAAVLQKARAVADESRLQIEVRNLPELAAALAAGARRILLDNFSAAGLRRAVKQTGGRAELEASGNISEDNIAAVAATGVDRISSGALTKNIRAADFSFTVRA